MEFFQEGLVLLADMLDGASVEKNEIEHLHAFVDILVPLIALT